MKTFITANDFLFLKKALKFKYVDIAKALGFKNADSLHYWQRKSPDSVISPKHYVSLLQFFRITKSFQEYEKNNIFTEDISQEDMRAGAIISTFISKQKTVTKKIQKLNYSLKKKNHTTYEDLSIYLKADNNLYKSLKSILKDKGFSLLKEIPRKTTKEIKLYLALKDNKKYFILCQVLEGRTKDTRFIQPVFRISPILGLKLKLFSSMSGISIAALLINPHKNRFRFLNEENFNFEIDRQLIELKDWKKYI